MSATIWERFHDADFADLWYANPGFTYDPGRERWHAGVWTGPQFDLICVMPCATNAVAEKALSPPASSPEAAVELALAKRKELLRQRGRCQGICEGTVSALDRSPLQCGKVAGHGGACFFAISRDTPWFKESGGHDE